MNYLLHVVVKVISGSVYYCVTINNFIIRFHGSRTCKIPPLEVTCYAPCLSFRPISRSLVEFDVL
jgi:hypothetical protein